MSNIGKTTEKVGNAASQFATDVKHKAQDVGHSAAEHGKDAAHAVAGTAKDIAHGVADKAKDYASTISQGAHDAAGYAGQKVQDATGAVAGGMKNLASGIRENAPREGYVGSASSAVADSLEQGGRYLQEHGLSGIGDDLSTLIRRNPVPAVLVGIGVGFLLARATSRS